MSGWHSLSRRCPSRLSEHLAGARAQGGGWDPPFFASRPLRVLAAQDTERAGCSRRRLLDETAILAFALSAALPEELHVSPELAYRLLRDSCAAGDGVPDEMVIGHTVGISASCGA